MEKLKTSKWNDIRPWSVDHKLVICAFWHQLGVRRRCWFLESLYDRCFCAMSTDSDKAFISRLTARQFWMTLEISLTSDSTCGDRFEEVYEFDLLLVKLKELYEKSCLPTDPFDTLVDSMSQTSWAYVKYLLLQCNVIGMRNDIPMCSNGAVPTPFLHFADFIMSLLPLLGPICGLVLDETATFDDIVRDWSGRREAQTNKGKELKQAGNALFVKKDFQGALLKYNEAISLSPHEPLLFLNRSACHMELGRYEFSLFDIDHFFLIGPSRSTHSSSYVKAFYRRAKALLFQNRYEAAQWSLSQGLRLSFDSSMLNQYRNTRSIQRESHPVSSFFFNSSLCRVDALRSRRKRHVTVSSTSFTAELPLHLLRSKRSLLFGEVHDIRSILRPFNHLLKVESDNEPLKVEIHVTSSTFVATARHIVLLVVAAQTLQPLDVTSESSFGLTGPLQPSPEYIQLFSALWCNIYLTASQRFILNRVLDGLIWASVSPTNFQMQYPWMSVHWITNAQRINGVPDALLALRDVWMSWRSYERHPQNILSTIDARSVAIVQTGAQLFASRQTQPKTKKTKRSSKSSSTVVNGSEADHWLKYGYLKISERLISHCRECSPSGICPIQDLIHCSNVNDLFANSTLVDPVSHSVCGLEGPFGSLDDSILNQVEGNLQDAIFKVLASLLPPFSQSVLNPTPVQLAVEFYTGDFMNTAHYLQHSQRSFDAILLSNIADYSGVLAVCTSVLPLLGHRKGYLDVEVLLGTASSFEDICTASLGSSMNSSEVQLLLQASCETRVTESSLILRWTPLLPFSCLPKEPKSSFPPPLITSLCDSCGKSADTFMATAEFIQCPGCQTVMFCSSKCQRSASHHQRVCESFARLLSIQDARIKAESERPGSFQIQVKSLLKHLLGPSRTVMSKGIVHHLMSGKVLASQTSLAFIRLVAHVCQSNAGKLLTVFFDDLLVDEGQVALRQHYLSLLTWISQVDSLYPALGTTSSAACDPKLQTSAFPFSYHLHVEPVAVFHTFFSSPMLSPSNLFSNSDQRELTLVVLLLFGSHLIPQLNRLSGKALHSELKENMSANVLQVIDCIEFDPYSGETIFCLPTIFVQAANRSSTTVATVTWQVLLLDLTFYQIVADAVPISAVHPISSD
eukprot:GILJ01012879.1.p1 GENE.GILJ01012879.1~~GILJ01012879.1.p1  ORF type:complete len:1138 (+),score=167.43 GILJ01012879.1:62-3475(+)